MKVRSSPKLLPGVPPPPDYYRDNLLRVLEYVLHHHGDLLCASERDYIVSVQTIGREAQRLYARLITRKGPYIRFDKLNYSEIDDHSGAYGELAQVGLLEINGAVSTGNLLNLFTHRELATLFDSGAPAKPLLVDQILAEHSPRAIRARLRRHSGWLRVTRTECLDLAQLLFFGGSRLGGAHGGLTVFILEDLGAARFENYAVSLGQRLFNNRAELRRYRLLRELNELSHLADDYPGLADAVLAALAGVYPPATRWERRYCDRTLNRLGRWFERRGYDHEALHCYARSASHPARERRVRVLRRLGEQDTARSLLDEMAAAPLCVAEQEFAVRITGGNRGQTPPTTIVSIDRAMTNGIKVGDSAPIRVESTVPTGFKGAGAIERRALAWLTASGGEGWHLENHLPLGLAGLAFWDLIFAPVPGAFLNPYQAGPLDLFWEDFAGPRREELARAKSELRNPARFSGVLKSNHADKRGIVNQLVSWRHWDDYLLNRVVETIPHRILFPLVCHVIENPRATRAGFPDLLLLHGARDYEFVEVKGPTDRLQPPQRAWFNYFRENDCKARVLKFKSE